MERTQISLTAAQADRLRRIAARRGTSMAALIRDAVDRVLPDEDTPTENERWGRALAAVGSARGDGAGASVDHDSFLDEAFAHAKRE